MCFIHCDRRWGQDVGVLCHTTPDELCQQIHKESKAVRPAALPLGRGCGAQQVGSEAGCPGAGMLSGTYYSY